ncbi:MAG: metallophosphoesterase family protein [Promethearchaeota archaeon]
MSIKTECIGIISDTHHSGKMDEKMNKLLSILKKNNVKMIIHAGDITNLKVIDNLKSIAPVKFIQGNMDFGLKFHSIPKYIVFNYYDKKIGVYHGSGGPKGFVERVYNFFKSKNLINELDIIICGHTHNGFIENYKEKLFINPGSPFDKKFAKENTIALLKFEIEENENEKKVINLNANLLKLEI